MQMFVVLKKNFTNLTNYINILNVGNKFSVIGLTETWTNSNSDNTKLYNIDGYSSVFRSRTKANQTKRNRNLNRTAGGVGLYINNNLNFKERHDIITDEVSVSLFIEILREKKSNILIGVLYRPPGLNLTLFHNEFDKLLTKISNQNKLCYLMGDYNINLLNSDVHSGTDVFINSLTASSFYPLIDKPTRITIYPH